MTGALNGIKVIDLTHVLAGPFCTYQLALLGADVLKVEAPSKPDCARGRGPDDRANAQGLGLNYQVQGGNKRALALDLSKPEGRDILLSLVRSADVFVENYSTGSLAKMGLGHETLCALNPKLIHCSITGFGDTGPKAKDGAYDNVIQAASGTIEQCGGVKPGVSFIDYSTGYSAAFAISAAMLQRTNTGKGCHISVSMLEVAMQMMAPEAAAAQHPIKASRPKEPGISAYDTADGRIMLGAFQPAQYCKFAQVLFEQGTPFSELETIEDWPDVWALGEDVKTRLIAAMKMRKSAEWITLLSAADLPIEPIQTLAQAVECPQLAARGYFTTNPNDPAATLPLSAFQMSEGGPQLTKAPPRHGEHSKEVLQDLGLEAHRIDQLIQSGIVK